MTRSVRAGLHPFSMLAKGILAALLIAACAGLLTASVSSASALSKSSKAHHSKKARGKLTVRVRGLPANQRVAGRLRGPGVTRRIRSSRVVLRTARPGVYRLTLSKLRIARAFGAVKRGAKAVPARRTVKVRVRPRKKTTIVGSYGTIINPGVRSVGGGVVALAGDPGDPSAVVFRGHRSFSDGAVLSIPPSGLLPRGLLSHVVSVSHTAGKTTVGLRAASVYEVAPNMSFDIPVDAQDQPAVARAAKASCGGTSGLSPYRNIKDISISGGWNTVRVLGVNIKVGIQAQVHFTVEAGVNANASVGVTCSFSKSVPVNGMAGPVPVTGAIEGTISAGISAGAKLSAGGSLRVDAGAKTFGVPPTMTWEPTVSFSNPRFTFSAETFAQVSASIGVKARLGIGNDNIASATIGVGSSIEFNGKPGACSFDAKFGQFSAEGKLLGFTVETPKTPPLFSKNLWHSACAASGGGGSPGGGSTGGPTGGGNTGTPGGGGDTSSGSGSQPGSSTPIGAPPAGSGTTYSETTGGPANTWTNYTNAGGTQGPTIPGNATVQIACKLPGFTVADGNTWWYKVASSPWSNAYYVSADAFYNNGATSGPLKGTPFVDPAVADCPGTSPPPQQQPPPAPTWAETTGGVAHTWTNYTNAGGSQGPSIGSNQTVAIACKLPGFRVADGNTWWYRIASAPWNGAYYVSADAFYNNGATSGSLHGTPFVDPAVANC